MATKLTLLLGRTGDVLAGLPLLLDAKAKGEKRVIMISEEYFSLLDGISIDRILWKEDWRDVRAAYNSVKRDWENITVLQQYSRDNWPVHRITDSFVKEMYRLERKLPLFGRLPLVFDRRSPQRESHWIAGLPTDKPIILLATCGFSSPFPHGDALRRMMQTFENAHVLNLDAIRAERIYDLLALFERAVCLVTVDSAMLHLAQAVPQLPVIALIASHPTAWHGSPAYAGQRLRVPYHKFDANKERIIETVRACLVAAPALGARRATA